MRLTNTELLEINSGMLNLGAPIEYDGQGYSQVHFGRMYNMSSKTADELTDFEAYRIAEALSVYKNTQLTKYADRIVETMEALYDSLKAITITRFDDKSVQLNWAFNQSVSNFIKAMDRTYIKWDKKDGKWLLNIKWCFSEELIDEFEKNGFSVERLRFIKAKIEAGETVEGMEVAPKEDPNKIYLVKVVRAKNDVDTLEIQTDYNKELVTVIGSIPESSYNSSRKVWSVYIETASKLYAALTTCGVKTDLTELAPWKSLVDSWNTEYPMKPVPNCLPFTPYDFQLEDIALMLKKRCIINGNEMGCGKTFEDIMVGYSIPLPKLIICPATLRLNWVREIKMVDPNADITVLYDNSKFHTAQWTIIGYPSVSKHLKALEAANFQVIFPDEAHYCQAINNSGNPDSQRAKAVLRLTATAGWVIPTTGTPKTNRNKNLYNTLRMIRHPLTRGKWAFNNYGTTYCDGQKSAWGWDYEGNSNDDQLHELINPYMVRHLKKDVLPHLKKMRHIIPVKVDLREYNYEISEYLKNRTNKEAEQLARLMRARKILATQKVGETVDFAKEFVENGEKIVLVTCFTDVVKVLEKTFAGNCVKIVGGMTDIQKEAAKDEFQTGKTQVIILNMVAGGVGITLTAAHNLIINDYDFVPGNIVQVEDRICRSGQLAEFSDIYYITAQGADVEEDFVDMLTYKSGTINAAVDGGNGETIDFRSLVEKTAGRTRTDKLRKIIKADEVPQTNVKQPKQPTQPKPTKTSSKPKDTTNWKMYTMVELEARLAEAGKTYTKCDNESINRMRAIMALKKC